MPNSRAPQAEANVAFLEVPFYKNHHNWKIQLTLLTRNLLSFDIIKVERLDSLNNTHACHVKPVTGSALSDREIQNNYEYFGGEIL